MDATTWTSQEGSLRISPLPKYQTAVWPYHNVQDLKTEHYMLLEVLLKLGSWLLKKKFCFWILKQNRESICGLCRPQVIKQCLITWELDNPMTKWNKLKSFLCTRHKQVRLIELYQMPSKKVRQPGLLIYYETSIVVKLPSDQGTFPYCLQC